MLADCLLRAICVGLLPKTFAIQMLKLRYSAAPTEVRRDELLAASRYAGARVRVSQHSAQRGSHLAWLIAFEH